jgi:hypothetical protein
MYTSLVLVYHISPTSLHWKLCLHLCDIFLYWGTTGFASFAVRHGRTAEARTRTTQPLACGFYPVRMTKGAQCIFARQRPLPCAVGKGNARHRSLSCATCDAWQRKGVDGRPSETASPALCRAPPTNTHDIEKKEKKQGRSVPASARPLPHRRWPSVLRSPRQPHRSVRRCLTSAAPPGAQAAGSLGHRMSREGVTAPWRGRGGREPPRHSRIEEGAAMPRPDSVPDGVPALPPRPGKNTT